MPRLDLHGLLLEALLRVVEFSQTTAAVIEGCEAAWRFFGGVFRTVIPDNLSAVVDKANPTEPRLNQAFVEYAQDPGLPGRCRPGSATPRTSPGSSGR